MASSKTLLITVSAAKDLQSIAKYTQQTWGTKQKKKYLSLFQNSFQELCRNPQSGKQYNELHQGLCSHLCQKHIIFYLNTKNELQIIRVLHQSMDVESHLS
ncbi:MAG: type II toxin-antitoxin system RelE/ParE family toxin [Ghiorsea sp.]